MRESLGLLDHAQWLADIAPYAAGAHLQDARWPDEDHVVPFEGEIPFDRLVPLLPSSATYVLELSREAAPEAIRSAVSRWKTLFPMNLKKILITLLQAAVTLLLLWWIFHDPSKRAQMLQALAKADPRWLAPAFLCFGLVLVCAAFRWQLLMKVQGISLSWFRVWQLVMIGMFYNLFLPGGTGGDLVKIFYAVREAPRSKSAVFLSVVVDRLTGMFALILVSSAVFLVFFKELTALPMVRAFTLAVCVIFAATLALVAFGLVVDRFHLAAKIPARMPGHVAILDTARAFSVYARDWKAVLAAVLISMPLNLFIFAGAIFAASAFPGNPGPAAMTSVIPGGQHDQRASDQPRGHRCAREALLLDAAFPLRDP